MSIHLLNLMCVCGLSICLASCKSHSSGGEKKSTPTPPIAAHDNSSTPESAPKTPESPPPPADKYAGPPATVEVVQYKRLPPISEAMVQVTVPTGGWTLNVDRGEVTGDTAKVYLTLEKPANGEMVTQALETLEQRFKSEKPPFYHAEVYIHEAQRGVQTFTTNYRLAAKK